MHPLTIWLALAGSTWSLFAVAEDHLTPSAREEITAWLRGRTPDWRGSFCVAWDSMLMAAPQVSTRVFRICAAVLVTGFLLLGLSGVLYPGTSGIMLLVLFLYAPLLLSLLALVNVLPVALSWYVHYRLLQVVRKRPVSGRWLLFWLVSTSLLTAVLALLAWALGFYVVHLSAMAQLLRYPVTWMSGYVEFVLQGGRGSLDALLEAAQLKPILVPGVIFPSFGIWLYTPCLPLVWGWLYVLSGTLLRRAPASRLRQATHGDGREGFLSLEAHPLHSLGAVAVGLLSVVYWTAICLWEA